MQNLTTLFKQEYRPTSGLLIRQHFNDPDKFYVESYEIDSTGRPLNFHPLSVQEAKALAARLSPPQAMATRFLIPRGVLPTNVLHIDYAHESVIWYTSPGKRSLFFSQYTGLTDGEACVPALVWKANRESLIIFAMDKNRRPTDTTKLFRAPLFNTSAVGRVCMGSVQRNIGENASLEQFIAQWENYFFNSYFSHLMDESATVTKVPTVGLWKELLETGASFPVQHLVKTHYTLSTLISALL